MQTQLGDGTAFGEQFCLRGVRPDSVNGVTLGILRSLKLTFDSGGLYPVGVPSLLSCPSLHPSVVPGQTKGQRHSRPV